METNFRAISYKFGDQFTIKPIADVHLGNAACDERAFKEYLRDSDESTYFIGIGDLMDAVIVSDIKRYRKGVDASKEREDIVDYQVQRAAAFLSPYSERILGLGTGNHEDAILTHCATDMTRRVCQQLNVPYLGYSGLYRLKFAEGGSRVRTVDIRYHHGWASGRTQGGQLTSNAKDVMHWDADVFFYGHGHKMLSDSIARLGIQGDCRLVSRDLVICLCGTFLKTYIDGEITYSEKKGYGPQRIGQPFVTVKPTRGGVRIKAHTA